MAREMTITLDDDVAAKLENEASKIGAAPQRVANDVLRRALNEPFEILGPFVRSRPGYSFDKVEQLLDEVEGATRK